MNLMCLYQTLKLFQSINNIKSKRSPGQDGICLELYKFIIDDILPFLNALFNEIFYKYLGLFITPKLFWSKTIEMLSRQTLKSSFSIFRYQRDFDQFLPKVRFKPF